MTDGTDPWLLRGTADEARIVLPRLGAVLKEYRSEHGLTQAALGELLGVDQTYVSLIERGRRQIRDVSFLLRICRLLGIPPADLGLSNELAAVRMRSTDGKVTPRDLPFRSLIGDPFDFDRRAVLPAITTLTLRRRRSNGTASFLLHWRDPAKVATAAGLYDVIPAGEFQPSSIAPYDLTNDFDIWRNIVREFSEELLGAPEHDGSRSTPIDYDAWPFYRLLGQARAEGKLTAFSLGAGLDALTLAATILTAVVIDDDVFDEAFRDAVRVNAEGITVFDEHGEDTGQGLPFIDRTVTRLLKREPMASPGAACLALAWRHRIALLTS